MNKENIETQLNEIGTLILLEESNDTCIVVIDEVQNDKLSDLSIIVDEIKLYYPNVVSYREINLKDEANIDTNVFYIKMQLSK